MTITDQIDLEAEIAEIAGRDPQTQRPTPPQTPITFPDLRAIEGHGVALNTYRTQLRLVLEQMAGEADDLSKALKQALSQLGN